MKFCDQPWTTFTITADGSMVPCLCGIWNTVGPIGNVINQDLNEILQSQKLKSFKEKLQIIFLMQNPYVLEQIYHHHGVVNIVQDKKLLLGFQNL